MLILHFRSHLGGVRAEDDARRDGDHSDNLMARVVAAQHEHAHHQVGHQRTLETQQAMVSVLSTDQVRQFGVRGTF